MHSLKQFYLCVTRSAYKQIIKIQQQNKNIKPQPKNFLGVHNRPLAKTAMHGHVHNISIYNVLMYSLIRAKKDHRIGIFMFKLVCAENCKFFEHSDSELTHFQYLAFLLHSNGICCCSEILSLQQQFPVKSKEMLYLNIQNKVTHDRAVQAT